MAQFFDYTEHNGMVYHTEDGDNPGEIVVKATQDLQAVVDRCTKIRNSGDADKGIKEEFWPYCTIPTWLEVELRSRGINIYDKNSTKDMLKIINTEYPHLKYTRLHHE